MKYKGVFYATILLTVSTLISCRKETSIENGSLPPGEFVAQIDGVQWVAADTSQSVLFDQGLATITGISADHRRLSIILYDTVVGVYKLDQHSSSLATFVDLDSSSLYAYSTSQGSDSSQAGGTVTITLVDPIHQVISGNFSFKGYRDIDGRQTNITSGMFYSLHYTRPATSANNDTLRASIGGVAWIGQDIDASVIGGNLGISGSAPNGFERITFELPPDSSPGTYSLDFTGYNDYIGVYNPTYSQTLISTSGSLTILENDRTNFRIRGNFQFEASDLLGSMAPQEIENGYFSVYYGQ